MSKELSVSEKELYVDIDGYKTQLFLCSSILAECERIKMGARVLLEEIKTSRESERTADIRVKEFLKDSISGLLGSEKAEQLFCQSSTEIVNLTAVLCYLISEIGMGIGSAEHEE